MTDELYRVDTGYYIQDGAVVLAEAAMHKVRAWDAAVAAGEISSDASGYEFRAEVSRSAGNPIRAAHYDELAAAMKAIEEV